jgi:hypothetical protein
MSIAFILVFVLYAADAAQDRRFNATEENKHWRFEYIQNLKPLVSVQRNGMEYLGHLDAAGNFVPDSSRKPFPVGSLRHSAPSYRMLNFPARRPIEEVFEFRSGMLIRGVLTMAGEFIPDEGVAVSAFKDYDYKTNSRRIYNLPGSFERVTEPKR